MVRTGRSLWKIIRHPAWRWLLFVGFAGWLFDHAVFYATEAVWFASVDQASLWTQHLAIQVALFAVFLLCSLGLSIAIMRVVARPDAQVINDADFETSPLPQALHALTNWRQRATRLGWLILFLSAILSASSLSHHADGWQQFLKASPLGFKVFNIDASFWVYRLPFLEAALNLWWRFSLVAFGVLLLGGAVRSLPKLVARQPQFPTRWARALALFSIHLLLLRALGYILESLNLGASGLTFDELFINLLLWLIGLVLCLIATALVARGLSWKTLRRPLIAFLAALLLPTLLYTVLWPVRVAMRGVEPPFMAQFRRNATEAAWKLTRSNGLQAISLERLPLNKNWPVWDEENLLRSVKATSLRDKGTSQLVDWKHTHLFPTTSGWRALAIGAPALRDDFSTNRDIRPETALNVQVLNPTEVVNGHPIVAQEVRVPPAAFYGIEGRPLFVPFDSALQSGVPFSSWGWKLAWAWRTRDLSLLVEGANARRMLVFRGAHEIPQKLRPDLHWGKPLPVLQNGELKWLVEGYASNSRWPGAIAAPQGAFAGDNFARAVVRLTLDAQTGAVNLSNNGQELETTFPTEFQSARRDIQQALNPTAALTALWQHRGKVGVFFGEKPVKELNTLLTEELKSSFQSTPVVWNDGKNQLVGQGYFDSSGALQEVAIKAIEGQVIGRGPTLDAALADFIVKQLAEAQNNPAQGQNTTAAQALKTFRAMVDAYRNNNTPLFGENLEKLRPLLEQLAAEKK